MYNIKKGHRFWVHPTLSFLAYSPGRTPLDLSFWSFLISDLVKQFITLLCVFLINNVRATYDRGGPTFAYICPPGQKDRYYPLCYKHCRPGYTGRGENCLTFVNLFTASETNKIVHSSNLIKGLWNFRNFTCTMTFETGLLFLFFLSNPLFLLPWFFVVEFQRISQISLFLSLICLLGQQNNTRFE